MFAIPKNKRAKTHKYPKPNLNHQSLVHPGKNCSFECAYDCVQLWYTVQHRTALYNLASYPPDNHHSRDVYWWGGDSTMAFDEWGLYFV